MSEQSEVTDDGNEMMFQTIEKLADLMLPSKIPLSELKDHLRGYNKTKAIEQLVERAREDPIITKVRLMAIYANLEDLFNNGGF